MGICWDPLPCFQTISHFLFYRQFFSVCLWVRSVPRLKLCMNLNLKYKWVLLQYVCPPPLYQSPKNGTLCPKHGTFLPKNWDDYISWHWKWILLHLSHMADFGCFPFTSDHILILWVWQWGFVVNGMSCSTKMCTVQWTVYTATAYDRIPILLILDPHARNHLAKTNKLWLW